MQRGGESERPVKGRRHRAIRPKARKAPTASLSDAGLQEQLDQRTRERDEALERETATSEILRIISNSPTDLQSALGAIAESAARLLDVAGAEILRVEGDGLRLMAKHGALAQRPVGSIRPINRGLVIGRAVIDRTTVQVLDLQAAEREFPEGAASARQYGHRTTLATPLLREGTPIGGILIRRMEVRPFTDKQIALLQNFAGQAVIAIENARLLNELRESLQQQTATADVLKVISSSPGDLEPVFKVMLENAVHICEAKFGTMLRAEESGYRVVAMHGPPPAYAAERQRNPVLRVGPTNPLARVAASKQLQHIADIRTERAYLDRDPTFVVLADDAGARTLLMVPMLKESNLVGAIAIYRQEVRPFTEKQIELLQNFAAQAVIAIENTRLLNELRQRTGDLSEALEQQTATSEVLKVISSSPGDLEPVFQAILANATRICDAKFGVLFRHENGMFRAAATLNAPQAFVEFHRERGSFKPPAGTPLDRLLKAGGAIYSADEATNPGAPARLGGARSLVTVPMRKDGQLIGAIIIYRQEVRPFTDKQIELLTNFAAQAVIAIENARLLNDLNQLNQQLEQRVTDQVSEIERMGKLRRFLPPQVADLIVASGTEKQLESHRREITALFCDLRGFTGFSESSDPEDVMALLREYHAAIGGIINKYGGTLERYAGDGVMVVFNDPIPVDNPALQAVLMAIEMRAAIGTLIEKWRKLGHDIGFGIGIAHGFATLGTIGFEGRFDYAAIGTVSNVASRLCDEAKPGQILISPRVLMAVEPDIAVEPVGDFALKGIRRPLTAYNVQSTKAAD